MNLAHGTTRMLALTCNDPPGQYSMTSQRSTTVHVRALDCPQDASDSTCSAVKPCEDAQLCFEGCGSLEILNLRLKTIILSKHPHRLMEPGTARSRTAAPASLMEA